MSATPTTVLIFFIFRTGSSFIMQTLKTCYNAYVYGDYGEILTLSEIKQTGFAPPVPDDKLEQYSMTNLDSYLRYLASKAPQNGQYVCSKISLFQMFDHIEKKSMALHNILSKSNTKIVVITRNLLDVYISWKKTLETKKWGKIDTTDIKLQLNPNEYIAWHKDTQNKYNVLFNVLKQYNIPYATISYEEMTTNASDLNKAKFIFQKLHTVGVNLSFNYGLFRSTTFLEKQDKNTKHKDQITNYHDFKEKMVENNLGYNIRV